MQAQRKQIGELLKDKGLIKDMHIAYALKKQKVSGERVGEVLENMGFVTQYDIATTMAEQEDKQYLDLDAVRVGQDVLTLFNKKLCLNNKMLPISKEGNVIKIATSRFDFESLQQIVTRQVGLTTDFYIVENDKLINVINYYYYFLENPVETLIEKEIKLLVNDKEMVRGADALLDNILQFAIKHRASDIHIRPMPRNIDLLFRIDGVMHMMMSLPMELKRLVSSIKMKANMDISEQRLPQDGSFKVEILSNKYYMRASTIVCPYGENIVIRVLPMETAFMSMSQIGFYKSDAKVTQDMFEQPSGIVLITGPTGSGKTTTLYAALQALNLLEKNIVTVENPIEYQIPLIRQTEVNKKAGYDFSTAVRYFLRHDPDVILVGEIRDEETAETALSASVTGHLVLSTLHTNSALGSIPRLKALGMPDFTMADAMVGIISQRLIRKLCEHCKKPVSPCDEVRDAMQEGQTVIYEACGCEACSDTGYLGRTLIYEALAFDKDLSYAVSRGADLEEMTAIAYKNGFKDIYQVAIEKVVEGVSSLDEIKRVLGYTKPKELH